MIWMKSDYESSDWYKKAFRIQEYRKTYDDLVIGSDLSRVSFEY